MRERIRKPKAVVQRRKSEGSFIKPTVQALHMRNQSNRIQRKSADKIDDRVLKITKYPWRGIISTNGAADVGFHKEPKPSESKSDNIWPSFMDGAKVTVLSKTSNNWLKVSRVIEGKKEVGYVDWRYVKTSEQIKEDKEAKIKERYFSLVAKGSHRYMAAIYYLVGVYNLDISHAEMSYNPDITGAYAITKGNMGDDKVPVEFGPACFDPNQDFGVLARVIAHELIHTKQKSAGRMSDHNEREFLAYYDTLTRTDMPKIKDKATLKFFVKKALDYYKKLPTSKKTLYRYKKRTIDKIKTKNGF